MKMRPIIQGAIAAVSIIALAGCSSAGSNGGADGADGGDGASGTVTFLLPNTTTTRFIEHDAPAFEAAMKELAPDVKVDIQNAEGDSETQIRQAETAILNGTKGIVLTSADPALSASILQKADEAGIPVISYEHEALDGPLTYQVINDPLKVGEAQGSYFAEHLPETDGPIQLARVYGNAGDNYTIKVKEGQDAYIDKLVEEGKVEVVCEDHAAGWDPANALTIVEQCLTKTSNNIDAIINSNDGTASGAIAALEAQDLGGKIPVFGGQDANLDALKYILQGLQEDTVFKDYAVEGEAAAKLMVALLNGEEPEDGLVNAEFDNGFAKVPAAYLPVTSVGIDNLDVVVDAGLYTRDEICEGVDTDAEFCKS